MQLILGGGGENLAVDLGVRMIIQIPYPSGVPSEPHMHEQMESPFRFLTREEAPYI